MADAVRVRFAPSPTGEPHLGNIRTALFNWLFARHQGGSFIVRIEDTDVVRKVEGAVEAILDSLRWLGLDWDEGPEVGGPVGPYYQSQRLHLYNETAERMIADNNAYYCYCSPETLDQMRQEQMKRKQPPRYDRRCRNLSPDERQRLAAEGITPVVRFKMPLDGETLVHDFFRGEVSFDNSTLDDLVLMKSDGYPTYHLANIVDDHAMEITHVLRAEEWLPSTPRHVQMYASLGYEPPIFAHLPMILGSDRSKLSKRHGATSAVAYRDMGYLPEAMFNFLALLGWSLDDHTEIISREDLVENFTLERVSKTAAIFNPDKLNWVNGVYLRDMDPDNFIDRLASFLERDLPAEANRPLDRDYVAKIAPLVQERIKTLGDAAELTSFFFLDDLEYDIELFKGKKGKLEYDQVFQALDESLNLIKELDSFDHDSLEGVLRPLAPELGLKTGDLFGVIRVAITGRSAAPPLFETMSVLGRETTLARIEAALALRTSVSDKT